MNRFSSTLRLGLLGSAAMLAAGSASAQSLAGPKPSDVQTGADSGCIGALSFNDELGEARVADGMRSAQTWSIRSVRSDPAVCAFPSARPVEVNCRRNGVNVDPVYCQDKQFTDLLSKGFRTVGDTRNWSTAQWVLPGQTDSGCVGRWLTQDGAVPMGCGDVQVAVSSSCTVTNVQSGTPDDPGKYCTGPRPEATRTVQDFRACSFAIIPQAWGPDSNTCGAVSHERDLVCNRSDGSVADMSLAACDQALKTYCADLEAPRRCNVVQGRNVEVEIYNLPAACTGDPVYAWRGGGFSGPSSCGSNVHTQDVSCVDTRVDRVVEDELCQGSVRPESTRTVVVNCDATAVCTGQTRISTWTDAGDHGDYESQCAVAGGDCIEKTSSSLVDAQGVQTDASVSSCYSGGGATPVGSVGPGQGPFAVHGTTYTSGTDGYCDYAASGAGGKGKVCLEGAYPARGCSSGIPNVVVSVPGKMKGDQGIARVTTSFANADGTNGPEGSECKATSTITNNGETKTLEATGTFTSTLCKGMTSDVVGGTSYTVEVDATVTQTSTGYQLDGTGTVTGVGCGTPTPSPEPTPDPTPSCTPTPSTSIGAFCEGGTNIRSQLFSYGSVPQHDFNSQRDSCYAAGGNCLHMMERIGVVNNNQAGVRYDCIKDATGVHGTTETDGPSDPVDYWDRHSAEFRNPASQTCTPTPGPTPTPVPTPSPTFAEIRVGWCGYTSSGEGRHACGQWGVGLKLNGQTMPGPSEFCTGQMIAGFDPVETPSGVYRVVGEDPLGLAWQTPKAGYQWGNAPSPRTVEGAQCVIHWKLGYSGHDKDDRPIWGSAFYDGPPTGKAGATYIRPKP